MPAAWRSAAERFAGPLAIVIAGVVMLTWTWRTWPDPLVDYGRELYLAWRVSMGEILYVDHVHFSGPFSVELNALCFRLLGTSIMTLVLVSLALVIGFTAMLYDLLVRLSDRLAATTACVVFMTTFAFGQFTRIGNYNWLCPYSYELTHGAMLAVAGLWCLERWTRTGRDTWLFVVGLTLGCLVLTKVETLLAGGAAVAAGLGLVLIGDRPPPRRWVTVAGIVAAGASLPILLTLVVYAPRMPLDTILEWPLGHFAAAGRPEFRKAGGFYRAGMGMDDSGEGLWWAIKAFGWESLVLLAALLAAFALRALPGRAIVAILLGVATGAILWRSLPVEAWRSMSRSFPFWTAIIAAVMLVAFVRKRDDRAARVTAALRTAFAVLALAFLAKMLLFTRIYHYGFVLAMPATMVLIVAMVTWLPAVVDRWGGYGRAVQAVGLGIIVTVVSVYVWMMQPLVARKTAVMGRGPDAIRVDDRGVLPMRVLREIETRVQPNETLMVMPQGVMLNYLAQRRNPTPYYLFDRTSRVLWSEEIMSESVRNTPPDWIVFIERAHTGVDPFGGKYYPDLVKWIRANYEPVWGVGRPFAGRQKGSGVALMRRIPTT